MQKSFLSIEGTRAWMAWWVVVVHSYDIVGRGLLPSGIEKLLVRPDVAVNVFIIISGFVITHLLLGRPTRYRAFIARRFLRIFPIYIACILLMILVKAVAQDELIHLGWPPGSEALRAERYATVADTFWTRLLLHLAMIQGAVPEEWLKHVTASFLTPTWTLSLEWQFYLVAPLLLGAFQRRRSLFVAACAMLLLGWLVARSGRLGTYPVPSMLLLSIPLFLVGIASRLCLESPRRLPLRTDTFLLAGGVLMLLAQSLTALVWFVVFTFVLAENDRLRPSRLASALMRLVATNRFICFAGRVSYSTYLIHYPLFTIAMLCWPGAGQVSQTTMLAFLWATFPLVLLASAASYRWIEQPFMKIGSRLGRPLPPKPALADS
jgi:peptidoglycan/LPS O-acetylase OafA/YrhL